VAVYSTGIAVTWNSTPFTEVVNLSWTYGGGAPKGRSVIWTDEAGTLSVECLGTANTGTANYGTRGTLVVSGGGQSLTSQAVWESLSVANEVNGVTRFTVAFKLLDN
jgi:hypothetical protein